MARYFSTQQTHIDELQRQLDEGLENRDYIELRWPKADSKMTWVATPSEGHGNQVFEVSLRPYGHVWGRGEHEHEAWTTAYKALEKSDVLLALKEDKDV